ncbi:hypothetical protein [Lichenihabitans psoromatis]|uniref:hypothetical protein n=1 Tax=Lichenihabitans psoromatis TaxID=2528642 RepID=UPI001035B8C2|nr:hypothetical protein [Lichenihabitans psoromatis]
MIDENADGSCLRALHRHRIGWRSVGRLRIIVLDGTPYTLKVVQREVRVEPITYIADMAFIAEEIEMAVIENVGSRVCPGTCLEHPRLLDEH